MSLSETVATSFPCRHKSFPGQTPAHKKKKEDGEVTDSRKKSGVSSECGWIESNQVLLGLKCRSYLRESRCHGGSVPGR